MDNISSELLKDDRENQILTYISLVRYEDYSLFWLTRVGYDCKIHESKALVFEETPLIH